MAKAFYEAEGGSAYAEDAVYQAVEGIGMVRVIVPDDTEEDDNAQDDTAGRQ